MNKISPLEPSPKLEIENNPNNISRILRKLADTVGEYRNVILFLLSVGAGFSILNSQSKFEKLLHDLGIDPSASSAIATPDETRDQLMLTEGEMKKEIGRVRGEFIYACNRFANDSRNEGKLEDLYTWVEKAISRYNDGANNFMVLGNHEMAESLRKNKNYLEEKIAEMKQESDPLKREEIAQDIIGRFDSPSTNPTETFASTSQ